MKKYFQILFILPILLLISPVSKVNADDITLIEDLENPDAMVSNVTLAWDANSEPDIAGYNVYYGRTSGVYTGQITVTSPTATVAIRGNRLVYFATSAFTTSGIEGPLSNEVYWPVAD